MEHLNVQVYPNSGRAIAIDKRPDICPVCHHSLQPEYLTGFADPTMYDSSEGVQIVFRCTRDNCHRLFIGYYRAQNSDFNAVSHLVRSEPVKQQNKIFDKVIETISKNFVNIYNQAFQAEQLGLDEICGVGYRKSFEFLIKDYLSDKFPDKADQIKQTPLGGCIENYVENPQIKAMAKRAVWLGNDETHYTRIWVNKDLVDLKKLIEVTIHWISMEKITNEVTAEMQ